MSAGADLTACPRGEVGRRRVGRRKKEENEEEEKEEEEEEKEKEKKKKGGVGRRRRVGRRKNEENEEEKEEEEEKKEEEKKEEEVSHGALRLFEHVRLEVAVAVLGVFLLDLLPDAGSCIHTTTRSIRSTFFSFE